jgi:hypothetical protein
MTVGCEWTVMTMTITVDTSLPRAKTGDDGGLRTGCDGTVVAYMTILCSIPNSKVIIEMYIIIHYKKCVFFTYFA